MKTFRTWLLAQARNDPVGDLARDVEADDCWRGTGPVSLRLHMVREHGAMDLAVEAARRAAAEWNSDRLEA